jgi:hypothetical protein
MQAMAALSVVVLGAGTVFCVVTQATFLNSLGLLALALTCLQLGFVTGASMAARPDGDFHGRRTAARVRRTTLEARSQQIY